MDKKNIKSKKIITIISVAIIVIIVAILAIYIISKREIAGTVNTLPFYYEELNMYAQEQKAAVAADFSKKHNLDSFGAEFWDKQYDGETPKKALYDKALEALIKAKIIQEQAIELQVVAPANFNELRKALAQENNVRSGGANSEIIYGPTEYSISEYNSYLMSQTIDDLKSAIIKRDGEPSEAELRSAFARLPSESTATHSKISGSKWRWSKDLNKDETSKSVEDALTNGKDPMSLNIKELTSEPFVLDTSTIHREDVDAQTFACELGTIESGNCILSEDYLGDVLYYVSEKEGGKKLLFEESTALARTQWINDYFDEIINKKIASAKVTIKPNAMQKGIIIK
ncbi:MAG: hypothetical protein RR424_02470 [Oscillospiraceae bacterium]